MSTIFWFKNVRLSGKIFGKTDISIIKKPRRFSLLNVYRLQSNKQTNKQTNKQGNKQTGTKTDKVRQSMYIYRIRVLHFIHEYEIK